MIHVRGCLVGVDHEGPCPITDQPSTPRSAANDMEWDEGSDPASPEAPEGDFESMLAGYDRIIHDKALQQELLDAGLLVKVDPATGEPIEAESPDA